MKVNQNDVDRTPFPNISNNIFYDKEFHIGAMLPMMGNTAGWGTPLAKKPIGKVVQDTNTEIAKKENLPEKAKKSLRAYTSLYDVDPDEDWSALTESSSMWINDKGEKVPKICPKCGSKVGIFLRGEPVYLCTNKKCEKYYGTVPMRTKHAKESTITESSWRKELPDSAFGIPEDRKYPLHDKRHVVLAIRMFNAADKTKERALAGRILKKMKEYDIPVDVIKKRNRLRNYVNKEDFEMEVEERVETMNTNHIVEEMFENFFGEAYNAGDKRVPDEIEPIVQNLEAKGYQVKYASPGHVNTKFDNDKNKDGVIYSKMVGTGRIIFSRDYKFPNTPVGWEWKVLSNGAKALYVKPYTYNEKMGTQEKAIATWRQHYLKSVKNWAASLPRVGTKDSADVEPDENFKS